MSFILPEQYRLTKQRAKGFKHISREMLDLISDETQSEDGFFMVPQQGKSDNTGFYLVRCTVVEGWRMVGVNIPSQGRTPSWEEMSYIKSLFFEENDVVWGFYPGKNTYIVDRWLHLWQPTDESMGKQFMPPIFQQYFIFRRAAWHVRWRNKIKRKWLLVKRKALIYITMKKSSNV